MTTKDYESVAAVLRGARCPGAPVVEMIVDGIAYDFADSAAQENANFDREHFLAAAEVQS